MATIKDIARISGYSIGTVSRVLNNRSDVSQEARTRIENTIKELNFTPNANAKNLKQACPSGISVIVRGMSNRFLVTLLENVQAKLSEHGESTSVLFLDETEDEVEGALKMLEISRPKGIIFIGGSAQSFHNSFSQITVPSVLVTGSASSLDYENLSSITTDDEAAAAFAINHLLQKGHRHISIIGGYPVDFEEDNMSRRISGALSALKDGDADHDRNAIVFPCYFSMQSGYDAANRMLDEHPETTAVFALGDMIAFGAMRAFIDRGLNVPEDISIIGFDGIDFSKFYVPRLTTVVQDIDQLSTRCVDDLLLRLSYPRAASHIVVPFSFVNGESVACPRETYINLKRKRSLWQQ